jgi:lipopolysaccharide/colanic/teichoic acid biosynthesis glycosyltransferase
MLYRDVYRTIFDSSESLETKLDAMKPWQLFIKRFCDIVFFFNRTYSFISCVSHCLYIVEKNKATAKIIFSQERIGYKGKPFYYLQVQNDERAS